jgi:DNA-directed RNA polymerase subunit RPC12/RpoP
MFQNRCPGAKFIRQPKPELFPCPSCGKEVEIWSDEFKARCRNCGKLVYRSREMSCLEWCAMAEECVGTQVFSSYRANRETGIRQALLKELDSYFGEDRRRIDHAKRVLGFAEELLKRGSGDWHVVVPASILHDVGIKAAEQKYGSSAGHLQEKEGPEIAKKMLFRAGLGVQTIAEICDIIAHHHSPGSIDTQNFKVLYDADTLVNLEESFEGKDEKERKRVIEGAFLTPAGREIAERVYLAGGPRPPTS